MNFELELDRVAELIQKEKAKRVCIQLADGLKPKAKEIVDFLKEKTGATVFVWYGSCYGACDVPKIDEHFDLLVQFGHRELKKND